MKIELTKEIIKAQALLIQEISKYEDPNNGGIIKIKLSSCYQLIAKTYGFKSWNKLSEKLKEEQNENID